MQEQGEIVRIWVKPRHGKPMREVDEAKLVPGHGLEENADCGPTRQVTFIEEELWGEMMRELGASVDPSARRANVMVRGLSLRDSRGKTLAIGDQRFEIAGETHPCRLMDEMHAGLRAAMDRGWRGGVYARVLTPGAIGVGDPVRFLTEE